jgi:hypothetical protein
MYIKHVLTNFNIDGSSVVTLNLSCRAVAPRESGCGRNLLLPSSESKFQSAYYSKISTTTIPHVSVRNRKNTHITGDILEHPNIITWASKALP